MERKIFITSTEPRSGKSLVTIGLMQALQGIIPKVGYMKPIGQRYVGESTIDADALLVRDIFGLTDDLKDINPASMQDAQVDKDKLFERVFAARSRLSESKDVVIFEGTDYTSTISALEFDINAELAHNLVAPVLLVASGAGKNFTQIVDNIVEATESFQEMNCNLLGVVVNRFETESFIRDTDKLREMLKQRDITLYGTLPPHMLLSRPRLREVAEQLGAEIFYQGDDLAKVVTDVKILAMTPENALGYVGEIDGYLLITPGDRVENILAAMMAQRSVFYPRFSGMILTGGLLPGPNVRKLFKGQVESGLTILTVPDDTYTCALRVNEVSGELKKDDREKIDLVNQLVNIHISTDDIFKELGTVVTDIVTPRMFQYRILEMAKRQRKRIALPEGSEPRIMEAAAEVLNRGICDVILLGDTDKIKELAHRHDLDLSGAELIDPKKADPKVLEDYAQTLYELRKHKSVTLEMARDLLLDPVYYATMMVYKGDADGFVSGSTHSTADTLGPVLRVIKTKPGVSLASSIFFMALPEKVLVYGDCALVENPTAEQMADIAITSADTARAFGIEPRVALLSYSTGTSGKGKDVDKVREAARIAKEKRPDLPIEGPIQYDAATSADVARVKAKGSLVAGQATVYIFPDLDAGNTAYKAVQRAANVPAIGPVMQGLAKPANDLSRGATVTDIIYTIAMTAIQAQSS
ncbi:MAG: phosphate acetyltransferase [Spirochaetaceae bacterium]|nr:MAG: phosphate acetyltransferase [Spirochaetaceae bacterium]